MRMSISECSMVDLGQEFMAPESDAATVDPTNSSGGVSEVFDLVDQLLATIQTISTETIGLTISSGAGIAIIKGLQQQLNDLEERLRSLRIALAPQLKGGGYGAHLTTYLVDCIELLTEGKELLRDLHHQLWEINKPARFLERPRLQLRLKAARNELSKSSHRLQSFLSTLRWPLNTVTLLQDLSLNPLVPSPNGQKSDRSPILNDALSYLDKVQAMYAGQSDIYHRFLDTMKKFKDGLIDTPGVIGRVSTLFAGNVELIEGFNRFLPPGYRIEFDAEDPSVPRLHVPSETGNKVITMPSLNNDIDAALENETPDFDHVESLVNSVRKRHTSDPTLYRKFMDILDTYQHKDVPIRDIFHRVEALFASDSDLLEEFQQFIPVDAQLRQGSSQESTDRSFRYFMNSFSKTFVYQTLDFARFETRFLRILPLQPNPEQNSSYFCELEHHSLINAPEYVALSYCWGTYKATELIIIDGCNFPVTTNLQAALRELRTRNVQLVWIDAVCINQSDNYEKSYQVARMHSIYSRASKVVTWLGESSQDSTAAMNAISEHAETHKSASEEIPASHGEAVLKLLERPYWTRLWIVQEIAKATVLEVWCGSEFLSWSIFTTGVNRLNDIFTFRTGPALQNLQYFCDAEQASRRGAARMLLSTAMLRTSYAISTDSRDKVYALLGLSRDGSEVVPTPNYVQEPSDIFNAVSRYMIVTQGQTALILLAGRRQDESASPTWLPLWSHQGSSRASLLKQEHSPPPWILRCVKDTTVLSHWSVADGNQLKIFAMLLERVRGDHEPIGSTEATDLVNGTGSNATSPASLPTDTGPRYPEVALRKFGTSLLECVGSMYWVGVWQALSLDDDVDSEPDEDYDDKPHALAAIWHARLARDWFPRLQAWYDKHRQWRCDGMSIETCVQNLSTHPKTIRQKHCIQEAMSQGNKFESAVQMIGKLEQGLDLIETNRTKLVRDNGRFRIMHDAAQDDDCIYRLKNCELPVILRPQNDGSYSVVGEMVLSFGKERYKDEYWERHFETSKDRVWEEITLV